MTLTSTAFVDGGAIPMDFSCDGRNMSPPLSWDAPPSATQALVIVVNDQDLAFTHWALYDLPPGRSLSSGVPTTATLASGGKQGLNSAAAVGYTGPCPPPGSTHHYVFRVIALDSPQQELRKKCERHRTSRTRWRVISPMLCCVMPADRIAIVAYSDYVCPWCYIALERVDRLQREFPVDVEWRPFELHPETPRDGASLVGRLGSGTRAAAYAQNIVGLAHESGITLRMPELVANSHLALEAGEFAREHGGFDAYHRALFAAYFEHGRNLGDPDALCDIARRRGSGRPGHAPGARGRTLRRAHRPHHGGCARGRSDQHADVHLQRRLSADGRPGLQRLREHHIAFAGQEGARRSSNVWRMFIVS